MFLPRFYGPGSWVGLAVLPAMLLAAATSHAATDPQTTNGPGPPSVIHSPSTPSLNRPYNRDPWRFNDGTYRYTLEVAGGVAVPAGSTRRYQNTAGGFMFGFGANLNKYLGAQIEYSFNNFGVPASITKQFGPTLDSLNHISTLSPVTGRVHLWSIGLAPVVHYYRSERFDAYVVGGGGFYRKFVRFSTTAGQEGCFSACLSYPTILGQYSNNAGGLNLGAGIAWRIVYGSKVKAFAEARYVWIDNKPSLGNGIYSPAYYRTGYFPVALGLKW